MKTATVIPLATPKVKNKLKLKAWKMQRMLEEAAGAVASEGVYPQTATEIKIAQEKYARDH